MVGRFLAIVVSISLVSGCMAGNNRDLSTHPPFSAYVGRTVSLLRPAYVIYEDNWTMPKYGIRETPLHDRLSPNYPLSAGHLIHIDSVRLKVTFDSGAWPTALGHTFVPQLGKEVRVFYYWGVQGGLFEHRGSLKTSRSEESSMTPHYYRTHEPFNPNGGMIFVRPIANPQ
jgi:hypothetical protein